MNSSGTEHRLSGGFGLGEMTVPPCSIHPPQCDVYMRGIVESKTIIRTKYSRKVKAGAHYYALKPGV